MISKMETLYTLKSQVTPVSSFFTRSTLLKTLYWAVHSFLKTDILHANTQSTINNKKSRQYYENKHNIMASAIINSRLRITIKHINKENNGNKISKDLPFRVKLRILGNSCTDPTCGRNELLSERTERWLQTHKVLASNQKLTCPQQLFCWIAC